VVQWLEEKRNVPKGLKVVDWKPKRESDWGLLSLSLAALERLMGTRAAGDIVRLFVDDQGFGRLHLDGLMSVWQGAER
jgi:hypothetical protein